MSDKLEAYVSFLTPKLAGMVEDVRIGATEPFTILSIIHWVAHQPDVTDKLSALIVKECQDILNKFAPNRELITSMASLTLRPDVCRKECFYDWQDYDRIASKVPYLEMMLGKRLPLIAKPDKNHKQKVFDYITGAKVDGK